MADACFLTSSRRPYASFAARKSVQQSSQLNGTVISNQKSISRVTANTRVQDDAALDEPLLQLTFSILEAFRFSAQLPNLPATQVCSKLQVAYMQTRYGISVSTW